MTDELGDVEADLVDLTDVDIEDLGGLDPRVLGPSLRLVFDWADHRRQATLGFNPDP